MMTLKDAWTLVKAASTSWIDDYAQSMGAALAYYTVFSIAPLLLIVISIAGLVFGEDAARGEIVNQLQGLMGADAAKAVEGLLASVSKPKQGIAATVIGIVVLLIGATTVFSELQNSLDRIWRAPARQTSGIWGLLRVRLLSFGMILGVGFLLIASLLVSALLAALGKWWAPLFGGWEVLAQVFNFAVSFGLVTVIFAMIYKIMPRVHIRWHDVWIGAAVTALLFTIGKFLISLYVGKSGVTSGFGAAGSLVVLLVWVYYSAQIFLVGAEFTWVYAHSFGSLKGQPMPGRAPTIPTNSGAAAAASPVAPAPASAAVAVPGKPLVRSAVVSAMAIDAATLLPATKPLFPSPTSFATLAAADYERHRGSLAEQAAAHVRKDPARIVGIALISGVLLRFIVPIASRLAFRRVTRRW